MAVKVHTFRGKIWSKTEPQKPAAHLDVSQRTSQHAQVGGLLLVDVGDVLLQRLKTLFQVRSSDRHKTQTADLRQQKWCSHIQPYVKLHFQLAFLAKKMIELSVKRSRGIS